jgi:hypothetical protein
MDESRSREIKEEEEGKEEGRGANRDELGRSPEPTVLPRALEDEDEEEAAGTKSKSSGHSLERIATRR